MLSEEAWVRTRAGPDRRALRIGRGLSAWVKEGGIILFGSRARCDWNDYSDVDLLIVVEQILDKATQHRLQNRRTSWLSKSSATRGLPWSSCT